jgi:hypothetical protein
MRAFDAGASMPEKVVAIDVALPGEARTPSGRAGARVLREPRTTIDVGVNVFVSVEQAKVARAGALGINTTASNIRPPTVTARCGAGGHTPSTCSSPTTRYTARC